jgi:hypothetical protein
MTDTQYNFTSDDHAAFHTTLATHLNNPRCTSFLDEDDKRFLQRIVEQSPDLVDTLFDTILSTIHSNVLDLHMIPSLVLLLFRALSGYLSLDSASEKQPLSSHGSPDLTSVLRFVIDSLIDSELFCLPDVKRKAVKDTMDTSLELLRSTVPALIEEEQRCCGWLFNNILPPRGSVRL